VERREWHCGSAGMWYCDGQLDKKWLQTAVLTPSATGL
jgi:hypothetical protein